MPHDDNRYGGAGMGFMNGADMPISEMRLPIMEWMNKLVFRY